METITRYIAGREREFRLDMKAAMACEKATGLGLLKMAEREGVTDVCSILFHSRVDKDLVSFDVFCDALMNEGYGNAVSLAAELIANFFLPQSGAKKAEEAKAE